MVPRIKIRSSLTSEAYEGTPIMPIASLTQGGEGDPNNENLTKLDYT